MSRKNFGAQPILYPQPVLIVATYDENGRPNAMNAAWGGICGRDEIMIDMSNHKTTENIAAIKAFTVSMADVEHLAACDYVGLVSAKNEPQKMEKAGFTTTKSGLVNAPIINELPVTLECELKEIVDGSKYIGRIVNVSVDERVLGEDGKVDLTKFHPIIFDSVTAGYYAFGERAGSAFKDGAQLK
ncbi:MAG: flavin reductase family protein [Oscillospiraceae bacterium]|jgi:flavin reductase (DIM6/NTAB) family NADH-FMN oxidoreductase RutF|nr:flavin reductase family protein [Oscillospiraceae bacterium]